MKRWQVRAALLGKYADVRTFVDTGLVESQHWTQRGAAKACDRINAKLTTPAPGVRVRYFVHYEGKPAKPAR